MRVAPSCTIRMYGSSTTNRIIQTFLELRMLPHDKRSIFSELLSACSMQWPCYKVTLEVNQSCELCQPLNVKDWCGWVVKIPSDHNTHGREWEGQPGAHWHCKQRIKCIYAYIKLKLTIVDVQAMCLLSEWADHFFQTPHTIMGSADCYMTIF